MKAYGGYVLAKRRRWWIVDHTMVMATTFAAENDEDAAQMASKIASRVFPVECGWHEQEGSVTAFSDAAFDFAVQSLAAELFDEWTRQRTPTEGAPDDTIT